MSATGDALLWWAFDTAARSHRDSTAFTDGSSSLTYGQLHTHALAAADRLRTTLGRVPLDQPHGTTTPVVALVTIEPGPTLAWMFGALSAGASVVLIAATGADRSAQLELLRPDVIVRCTGTSTVDDPGMIDLAPRDHEAAAAESGVPPGMIVCTSGTTGAPKAVVHSHETLGHAVRRLQLFRLEAMGTPGRPPRDERELARDLLDAAGAPALGLRYATSMPLSTMAGLTVALQALLAGESLVVLPDPEPVPLLDALRTQFVTNVSLTPFLAQLLLRAARAQRPRLPDHLLLVGIGGGPVAPNLPQELEAVVGCPVAVGYGMTETGGALTMGRPTDTAEVRHRTVGRPLPGVQFSINPGTHALAVRCDSTAVGYLSHRRTLSEIDRGAFATGDLAFARPDGALELRGRADTLILRGGRNIDPARIECALEVHPAVRRAVAFGRANRLMAGEQDIWTVVELEQRVDESELRAHCNQLLGPSLTPRRVIAVDALPLTPDGAVRRDDLESIARAGALADASRQ